jgi:hypothetical protein
MLTRAGDPEKNPITCNFLYKNEPYLAFSIEAFISITLLNYLAFQKFSLHYKTINKCF